MLGKESKISRAIVKVKEHDSKELASYSNERPVFITALPRAGTPLLLECFASVPEFASHCYRDMPFVPIPCLWNRFSSNFQQAMESQERAHGDGMQIIPDSPEALEEVSWKIFFCGSLCVPYERSCPGGSLCSFLKRIY